MGKSCTNLDIQQLLTSHTQFTPLNLENITKIALKKSQESRKLNKKLATINFPFFLKLKVFQYIRCRSTEKEKKTSPLNRSFPLRFKFNGIPLLYNSYLLLQLQLNELIKTFKTEKTDSFSRD
jgi:hypothetical protein